MRRTRERWYKVTDAHFAYAPTVSALIVAAGSAFGSGGKVVTVAMAVGTAAVGGMAAWWNRNKDK